MMSEAISLYCKFNTTFIVGVLTEGAFIRMVWVRYSLFTEILGYYAVLSYQSGMAMAWEKHDVAGREALSPAGHNSMSGRV